MTRERYVRDLDAAADLIGRAASPTAHPNYAGEKLLAALDRIARAATSEHGGCTREQLLEVLERASA